MTQNSASWHNDRLFQMKSRLSLFALDQSLIDKLGMFVYGLIKICSRDEEVVCLRFE
jgi:hypothetical protein